MYMDLPEFLLLKNINSMLREDSIYIIGAGASCKYVKPTYDIYNEAKKSLHGILISTKSLVPIVDQELTRCEKNRFLILGGKHTLHETCDGKFLIDESNSDIYDDFLAKHPWVLELIAALKYSPSIIPKTCPEYEFMNHINKKSFIINMNHDHLAETFIKDKTRLISLHGTISPQLRNLLSFIETFLCDFLESGNEKMIKHHTKGLYIANIEEEPLLISTKEYEQFIKILHNQKFTNIFIIGYSFFHGNDNFTYSLVRDYCLKENPYVFTISPETSSVTEDLLYQRMSNPCSMTHFNVSWHAFTHAIYSCEINRSIPYLFKREHIKRFLEVYFSLNTDLDKTTNKIITRFPKSYCLP